MIKCPICSRETAIKFDVVEETGIIEWNLCMCQTMFHSKPVDKKFFGKLYLKHWQGMADMKERFEYLQRTYVPIIEEMTFGRKFIDVGYTLPYGIDYLKSRGWITTGIDLVPNEFIKGDFETVNLPDRFDFINMGHCLESFHDPVKAIQKAYKMLNYNGFLLITTPNPEMIFEIGLPNFGHWNYRQSQMFISKNMLEDIARRTGFDIVMSYRNISQRFVMHNDLHLLLQRKTECL